MQRQDHDALAPDYDARHHNPISSGEQPQSGPLHEAPLNRPLRIVRLGRTRMDAVHLRSLGLTENQHLTVLRGNKNQPRVIASGANRVALGVDLARTITVEVA